MSILDVPDPDGFLYIVADSHLDEKKCACGRVCGDAGTTGKSTYHRIFRGSI